MLQGIFAFFNQKVISTIIVACCGIVAVMLTHYWTNKREVRASHRLRQSEVYEDFVENTIVKLMKEAHDGQIQQQTINDLQHYIIHFVGTLIIWGSSSVIHAYRHFQKSVGYDPEMLISPLEDLKWPHCRCQNNGKISKIIESHRHSFSRNRPQPALHNRDSGEVVGDYRNGYNELIHRKELVPSGTVSDKHLHT